MTVHYDMHKICPVCEHTFYFDTTKASPGTWAGQVYCSPLCARKHDNARYRRGARGKPVGTPNSQVAVFEDPTVLPRDWRGRAACRPGSGFDPEIWFPAGTSGPALLQIAKAKTICEQCPSQTECLEWALESGQDSGVWGGMDESERRALKRRNARTRARTA